VTACECCYVDLLYFQDSLCESSRALVPQVRLSVVTVRHVKRFRSTKSVVGRAFSRSCLSWVNIYVSRTVMSEC
jgi:hypothetical protein